MTGNDKMETQAVLKSAVRVVLATGLLLLVPLVAMQFTSEVVWDLADFVAAGILLAGTGLTFVVLAPRVRNRRDRTILGVVLAGALLLIWAELAVGIFGD